MTQNETYRDPEPPEIKRSSELVELTIAASGDTSNAIDLRKHAFGAFTIPAGVNEVQVVSLTGAPTGGTFTLTFDGQETTDLDFDSDAAAITAALEALSNIGAGDVSVTLLGLDPFPSWEIEFTSALAIQDVAELVGDGANLTGGESTDVDVTTTTAGTSFDGTEVSFLVSADGSTFAPLYDADNAAVSVVVTQGRSYQFPTAVGHFAYAKIVSDATETAERSIPCTLKG